MVCSPGAWSRGITDHDSFHIAIDESMNAFKDIVQLIVLPSRMQKDAELAPANCMADFYRAAPALASQTILHLLQCRIDEQ
jgi:hypothetical protein